MAPTPRALPPAGTALLLALVGLLLLFRLGAVPLLGPDEPRYARGAVEMHRAGEWVRATLQGGPWLEAWLLRGPEDPRVRGVAVEMHRAGGWVRPTLQGRPWLEKPPLYYWLAGAAFRALGETEAAARLPSVLAALVLVGTTALLGAR